VRLKEKQFKPSGYFDNNLLSGMTPAISEVVLKETQYFSSKLILVLQIKLKYMMSLKKFDTGMSGICFVPTKPIKNQEIKEDQIRQRLEVLKSHRLDSRFSCANGHENPEIKKWVSKRLLEHGLVEIMIK
jgi:hypothetical protein